MAQSIFRMITKANGCVFFSHPGDFTPVCTTEIMTFASMAGEFASNNSVLLGLSVDSNPSHIDWCRSMEKYHWKNIMNPKITFPIVADDFGTGCKALRNAYAFRVGNKNSPDCFYY